MNLEENKLKEMRNHQKIILRLFKIHNNKINSLVYQMIVMMILMMIVLMIVLMIVMIII